jgi:Protein of unknown function (DUF1648)
MVALLAGIAGAFIAATVLVTANAYGSLPERIPIHFGLDGTANNYGPRSMAWLLVAVQLLVAATGVTLYLNGSIAIGMVAIIAICWRAQLLILSAASGGQTRVPMFGFWVFSIVVLALGATARRFLM